MKNGMPKKDTNKPIEHLENVINNLGNKFSDEPGFSWKNGGFEVIHANWPAYPIGEGVISALNTFGYFPGDSKYFKLDHIDRCTLFLVGERGEKDPYDKKNFHIAIWDDDLRQCLNSKFIYGVTEDMEYFYFPKGFIELTNKGEDCIKVNFLLGSFIYKIDNEIIDYLYDYKYDVVISELSKQIELSLRRLSGLSYNGHRLVEKCFGDHGLLVPNGLTYRSRLILRNIFRTYVSFVRNRFHHELPSIDMVSACILIRRSCELLDLISFLEGVINRDN